MNDSDDSVISEKTLSMLYGFLAALGIAFYLSWSFMYGTWFDLGVYTVTIIMVGFGLIGFFLYSVD